MEFLGPLLIALLIPLLWVMISYNRLVRLRQLIRDSWANVETELNRRYDLIPNLVETVKGYAAHEREVLREVTEARSAAIQANGHRPAEQQPAEVELVQDLRRLIAVAEDYPDLKASEHFLHLQRELVRTEDRIQLSRRIYNANVRDLNTRVEQFPSMIVARLFHFEVADYFEVDPVQASTPEISLD